MVKGSYNKSNSSFSSHRTFNNFNSQEKEGPWFDKNMNFQIIPAKPDNASRNLASVYDHWENLFLNLNSIPNLEGVHRTDNIKFIPGRFTPLLEARVKPNKTIPLAVASYPGKGRAVWVFTDNLWKLALSKKGTVSRNVYHNFMQSTMTWLLREELKKPLIVSDFTINTLNFNNSSWVASLQGPATKFIDPSSENWTISICGTVASGKDISIRKYGRTTLGIIWKAENIPSRRRKMSFSNSR